MSFNMKRESEVHCATCPDAETLDTTCPPSGCDIMVPRQLHEKQSDTSSHASMPPTREAMGGAQLRRGCEFTESNNEVKDVHYYAILAQVQKVVCSDRSSMSLGKILADANKRGVSLDVVTEIYKQERFKASSQKALRDAAEPDDTVNTRQGSVHTADSSNPNSTNPSCFTPVSMVDVEVDNSSDTALRDSPECDTAHVSTIGSQDNTPGSTAMKNTLSSEIADGMIELSRLCDQATALFDDSLENKLSHNEVSSVTASESTISSGAKSIVDHVPHSLEADYKEMVTPATDYPVRRFEAQVSRLGCTQSTHGTCFGLSNVQAETVTTDVPPKILMNSLHLHHVNELEHRDTGTVTPGKFSDNHISADMPVGTSGSNMSPLDSNLKSHDSICHTRNKESDSSSPGDIGFQIQQSKHLVKRVKQSRKSELSPQEFPQTVSLNDRLASEDHSAMPGARKIKPEYVEEIDSFLLRFSIQADGDLTLTSPKEHLGHACEDTEQMTQGSDLMNESESGHDGLTSQIDEYAGSEDVSFDAGGGKMPVVVVQVTEGEWPSEESRHLKGSFLSRDGSNMLPKHLGVWKSPWYRNPHFHPDCDGGLRFGPAEVSAAGRLPMCHYRAKHRHCVLPLAERAAGHTGYCNVDFYSLYEATLVQATDEDIDQAPWEYRDVGQRFLQEKSVESRNWFGMFELERGNDRTPNPVCRPKSLEVLVTKIPAPGEWSEDWFTTWKSRRDNPNNLIAFAQDESVEAKHSHSQAHGSGLFHDSPSLVRKVAVEIGSLCPVRVRGSEQRVSRIHPEFTSSLRRSRWRKKYLKGSLFPSD